MFKANLTLSSVITCQILQKAATLVQITIYNFTVYNVTFDLSTDLHLLLHIFLLHTIFTIGPLYVIHITVQSWSSIMANMRQDCRLPETKSSSAAPVHFSYQKTATWTAITTAVSNTTRHYSFR